MKLGTRIADDNIKYLMSKGFSKEHATIITENNNNKDKKILECLFKHKNIFPNYKNNKGGYMLNYNYVINLLNDLGIKYYTGNISSDLSKKRSQLSKFISIDEETYQRVLNKDPYFVEPENL